MKKISRAELSFFQGDLGFIKLPKDIKIPENFKKLKPKNGKGLILAYGEVSGHTHRFEQSNDVDVYYNPNNGDERGYDEMILFVKKPTILIHEEHDPVLLPIGVWKKWVQKEYNFEEEYRMVAD